MFARGDRREWAVLGLVALAWCLLIAPVVHRETHAHGSKHSHGAPGQLPNDGSHGSGSFEHQLVAFVAPAVAPSLSGTLLVLGQPSLVAPAAPSLRALRRVEQSQAP